MLSFDPDASVDENVEAMSEDLDTVKSGKSLKQSVTLRLMILKLKKMTILELLMEPLRLIIQTWLIQQFQ